MSLKQLLENNKIFLNMVIHDMKNPTNQIKFAIDQALLSIDKIDKKTQNLENTYSKYLNRLKDSYKSIIE